MQQWTPALSVGIEFIDGEHQVFFVHLDHLRAAMGRGAGSDEVLTLLIRVEVFVTNHFEHERQEMERYGYPDMEAHVAEHEAELLWLAEQRSNLENGSLVATVGLVNGLSRWLVEHVAGSDVRLGAWLKQQYRALGVVAG